MQQRYAVHCKDLGHECHEDGKVFGAVDYADAASQWAQYETTTVRITGLLAVPTRACCGYRWTLITSRTESLNR